MGVLPLALASGAGAASQNAIGIAVIGGMLGATFLAILFVPMFYVLVDKIFHGGKSITGTEKADQPDLVYPSGQPQKSPL